MRMPRSLTRRLTRWAAVPKTPVTASITAKSAVTPRDVARARGVQAAGRPPTPVPGPRASLLPERPRSRPVNGKVMPGAAHRRPAPRSDRGHAGNRPPRLDHFLLPLQGPLPLQPAEID